MKKIAAVFVFFCMTLSTFAGSVEKVFTFSQVTVSQNGKYQSVTLDNTMLAGLNGEPMLPYHQIAMMLPPGEKAVSVNIVGEALTAIPGSYDLFPQQLMQPLSKGPDGKFIKNETVYSSSANYPVSPAGTLINSYLNGYAFALSTFTPVVYNPAKKTISYYQKVTVQITTRPDVNAALALKNLTSSANALKRVRLFAQNPEMMGQYPAKGALKTGYNILIITPAQFQAGFQDLVNYYNIRGQASQIATTEAIAGMTGQDLQEKMRNYIISEYQANGIDQVILGGDVEVIPYRGFYCYVISGSGYEDNNIPADIYFSALDGNWNTNGDSKWGEPGEDDLLPELSVGRMSFSNTAEQANMVHKSVSYQGSPVTEEMKQPLMVSEFLYDPPLTYGSDYLELLIDSHNDNGYTTYGIPSAQNTITRLYDTAGYNWSVGQLLSDINSGKSFIHHCGHSNATYMMRMSNWDITNQNFFQVDGITHNYQLMYTHGCICGAFDESDCIAELSTSISNFLAGGVFNSRYGWFDQGTTEGPSAHLHREFISAMYNPDPNLAITELGSAHTMSKIKTAPWIGLPGEFEPGAQRWCHYDCNVLGDPSMKIWTDNPVVGTHDLTETFTFSVSPNPCTDRITLSCNLAGAGVLHAVLLSITGQTVLTTDLAIPGHQLVSTLISLPQLDPGIYFLSVTSGNGSLTRKVVVTR
ncbi:MAG: C25 family cysteine peptidase [Bacteroidetes bacterium]|nr:C25 family cysteine peptidase [Bacteroidota bacterium]